MLKKKVFPEPRLVIFCQAGRIREGQALIIVENEVMFEITDFNVFNGLVSLIGAYYALDIAYPQSASACGLLLYIQEGLMEQTCTSKAIKKGAGYRQIMNALLD